MHGACKDQQLDVYQTRPLLPVREIVLAIGVRREGNRGGGGEKVLETQLYESLAEEGEPSAIEDTAQVHKPCITSKNRWWHAA